MARFVYLQDYESKKLYAINPDHVIAIQPDSQHLVGVCEIVTNQFCIFTGPGQATIINAMQKVVGTVQEVVDTLYGGN